MARDFYMVLGIPRDADLEQIRRAYRRLVHALHPDTAEVKDQAQQSCECPDVVRFMEVREAYQVLSDPEARAAHDRFLDQLDREVASSVEPQAPKVTPAWGSRPHPLSDRAWWTDLDDWLGGWLPGIPSRAWNRQQQKDLFVEISLNSAEAACGGRLTLSIPYELACPNCEGLGCPQCSGRGWLAGNHDLELSLPPDIADGTRQRLPLTDLGLPDVSLIVHVTVRP